MHINQTDVVL